MNQDEHLAIRDDGSGRTLNCRYCGKRWRLNSMKLSLRRQLKIIRHLRAHFCAAPSPTARALAQLGLMEIELRLEVPAGDGVPRDREREEIRRRAGVECSGGVDAVAAWNHEP